MPTSIYNSKKTRSEYEDDCTANDPEPTADLFAESTIDPNGFRLSFGTNIAMTLSGIQARNPQHLQSTGLTLWKATNFLCDYLVEHSKTTVRNKSVLEIGAGLGTCGILAHKLGARYVVLTDGDTETLQNMRRNVAANCAISTTTAIKLNIFCKQLLWGCKVEAFIGKWGPKDGNDGDGLFDVVMGSEIFYAQEVLGALFETILLVLRPGGIFVLSYRIRQVTIQTVTKRNGLDLVEEPQSIEGVYVFSRPSCLVS
jgi:predicted nicotinamide N-methyase